MRSESRQHSVERWIDTRKERACWVLQPVAARQGSNLSTEHSRQQAYMHMHMPHTVRLPFKWWCTPCKHVLVSSSSPGVVGSARVRACRPAHVGVVDRAGQVLVAVHVRVHVCQVGAHVLAGRQTGKLLTTQCTMPDTAQTRAANAH